MLGSLGVILDGLLPNLDTIAASSVQAGPSALGPIVVDPAPTADPQALRVMDLLVSLRLPVFQQIHLGAMAFGWLILMGVLFTRPIRESKLRGPLVIFAFLLLLLGNVFAFAVTIPEAQEIAQQEVADQSGRSAQGDYGKELLGNTFFHPRVQNAWVLDILFLITGFVLRATRREYWRNAWKQIRARRTAMVCLGILILYVATALLDSVGWYEQTKTEEYDLARGPSGDYLVGEAARVMVTQSPDFTTLHDKLTAQPNLFGLRPVEGADGEPAVAVNPLLGVGSGAPKFLLNEKGRVVIHEVKPAFEAEATTLLDMLLEGQRNKDERNYSAPFASLALQKRMLDEWRRTFKLEVPADAERVQIDLTDVTSTLDGAQVRVYASMTVPPRVRFKDPKTDYIEGMKRRGLKWDPHREFPAPTFDVVADWTSAIDPGASGSVLTITREDGKLFAGTLYIMVTALAPQAPHEDILQQTIAAKMSKRDATADDGSESTQTQTQATDSGDAGGDSEAVADDAAPAPAAAVSRALAPFPSIGELQYSLRASIRTGGPGLLPAPKRVKFGEYDPGIIDDVEPGTAIAGSFPEKKFSYDELRYPGDHPFGTDQVGNDTLVAGLKGIRTGIIIGGFVTLLAIPFSIFFGTAAGYFGGWVDDVVQYIYSTLASIPSVLLIVAFMLLFKISETRLFELTVILGITSWTGLCRLLRAETLKLREMEYVQAARAFGVPDGRIIMRHVVPNLMHIVLITFILSFSGLVLAEAVLSYIGIGVDPTAGSWGNMINSARGELARDPIVYWSLLSAFVFMFILVLSANLFGDAVRDALDPRLRTR